MENFRFLYWLNFLLYLMTSSVLTNVEGNYLWGCMNILHLLTSYWGSHHHRHRPSVPVHPEVLLMLAEMSLDACALHTMPTHVPTLWLCTLRDACICRAALWHALCAGGHWHWISLYIHQVKAPIMKHMYCVDKLYLHIVIWYIYASFVPIKPIVFCTYLVWRAFSVFSVTEHVLFKQVSSRPSHSLYLGLVLSKLTSLYNNGMMAVCLCTKLLVSVPAWSNCLKQSVHFSIRE